MPSVLIVLGLFGAAFLAYQFVFGAILLIAIVFWLLKKIVSAISAKPEVEPAPSRVSNGFKASVRGTLVPDISDGKRVYFNVEERSHSSASDREATRRLKSNLIAAVHAAKNRPAPPV